MWSNDCLEQFLKRYIRSLLDPFALICKSFQNRILNVLHHVIEERFIPFAHFLQLLISQYAVFCNLKICSGRLDISEFSESVSIVDVQFHKRKCCVPVVYHKQRILEINHIEDTLTLLVCNTVRSESYLVCSQIRVSHPVAVIS